MALTKVSFSMIDGAVANASDYGDISVDVGAAVNAAFAAGNMSVYIPEGTHPLLTTIDVSGDKELTGSGWNSTIIEKQADVAAIEITDNGIGCVRNLKITSAISDTTVGLLCTAAGGYYIDYVYVGNCGGHGIQHVSGNRTCYGYIATIDNGGSGFYCDGVDPNSNAIKIGWLDTRGNAGHGIYTGSPWAQSWEVSAICQNNGLTGATFDSVNSRYTIYSENNAGGLTVLESSSRGCQLKALLGSVVDNGIYNIIYADLNTKGTQGVYAQRVNRHEITDGVTAGNWTSQVSGVRQLTTTCSGSGTSNWILQHDSDPATYSLNITQYGKLYNRGLYPLDDALYSLGSAPLRWSVVYAATGTINTSDEREKQDIATIDDTEKRVAVAIRRLVKKFRFKDAIERKGDDARIHFGVIAQEVKAAFEAEGLDAHRYGILCYDEWEAVFDDDGNEVKPAGDRYGVRYDELFAFIISTL